MGLIHSIPQFCPLAAHDRLRDDSAHHKTKTGHPPRQRLNGPDHKLPEMEVAMADKANTRIPRERQDARYVRAVPIGEVVHNILVTLKKRVSK